MASRKDVRKVENKDVKEVLVGDVLGVLDCQHGTGS